jgi:hypothetical protein
MLPAVCSWLIAIAYWLAGGFIKSGLGNRIAYSMVAAFGKTTLGLTYSLVRGVMHVWVCVGGSLFSLGGRGSKQGWAYRQAQAGFGRSLEQLCSFKER